MTSSDTGAPGAGDSVPDRDGSDNFALTNSSRVQKVRGLFQNRDRMVMVSLLNAILIPVDLLTSFLQFADAPGNRAQLLRPIFRDMVRGSDSPARSTRRQLAALIEQPSDVTLILELWLRDSDDQAEFISKWMKFALHQVLWCIAALYIRLEFACAQYPCKLFALYNMEAGGDQAAMAKEIICDCTCCKDAAFTIAVCRLARSPEDLLRGPIRDALVSASRTLSVSIADLERDNARTRRIASGGDCVPSFARVAVESNLREWVIQHLRRGGTIATGLSRKRLDAAVRTQRGARRSRKRGGPCNPYFHFLNGELQRWKRREAPGPRPSRKRKANELSSHTDHLPRLRRQARDMWLRSPALRAAAQAVRAKKKQASLNQLVAGDSVPVAAQPSAIAPSDTLWQAGDEHGPLSMERLASGVRAHRTVKPQTISHEAHLFGPVRTGERLLKQQSQRLFAADPSATKPQPLRSQHLPCHKMTPGFCHTRHAAYKNIVLNACVNLNRICSSRGGAKLIGTLMRFVVYSGHGGDSVPLLTTEAFVGDVRLGAPPLQVLIKTDIIECQEANGVVELKPTFGEDDVLTSYAFMVGVCQRVPNLEKISRIDAVELSQEVLFGVGDSTFSFSVRGCPVQGTCSTLYPGFLPAKPRAKGAVASRSGDPIQDAVFELQSTSAQAKALNAWKRKLLCSDRARRGASSKTTLPKSRQAGPDADIGAGNIDDEGSDGTASGMSDDEAAGEACNQALLQDALTAPPAQPRPASSSRASDSVLAEQPPEPEPVTVSWRKSGDVWYALGGKRHGALLGKTLRWGPGVEMSLAVKCQIPGHTNCKRSMSFRTYGGGDKVVACLGQWLVAGLGCQSRDAHMNLPRPCPQTKGKDKEASGAAA